MAEAPPAQTPGAAAEQPAEQPPVQRMLSSQRPPPSPFEDVPAAHAAARPPLPPGTVAAPSAAADAAADADRRSPRGMMKPSKSALKISSDGGAPAATQQTAANRALSWADTHGKDIHHVQEYQPSEHGSESFVQRTFGCNCCIQ